ncbi:MAG TPA: alkaline phosphatase family protein [Sphingomonas sp.]|nr:alkaline phosphatase family protein [Sphingomonas sp.]
MRRATSSVRSSSRLAVLAAAMLAMLASPGFAQQPQPQPQLQPAPARAPRLIVVISIDQFGSALFSRYRDRFTGGLARIAGQGMVFPNAYQSHAITETCPGHSTLLTGTHPNRTGITGNSWFEPGSAKETYCLASTVNRLAHDARAEGRGPERLITTTVGDWIKAAGGAGRVVAVAGKDRSALTMGGHRADAVFWYDDKYAGFTTFVAPGEDAQAKLAPVAPVNAALRAQAKPRWDYADDACRALEGSYAVGQATWHAKVPPDGWSMDDPAAAARSFRPSPFLDLATLDAARAMIDRYALGADDATDLLTVGLSATDAIGHVYGAGGPEMCDHLGRLDRALGDFLDRVFDVAPDALVVVTADHGGSDMPERLRETGYPDARRLESPAFLRALNDSVAAELGLGFAPFVVTERGYNIDQLYFASPAGGAFTPALQARAVAAALTWLRARPEVVAAHARTELLADPRPANPWPEGLTLRQRMAESAYPGRSGDIVVAYQPLASIIPPTPGFYLGGHGTPWDYDRRVPIIFLSRAIPAQERPFAVETVDIAPTIAAIIHLPAPAGLDGRCLPVPGLTDCADGDAAAPNRSTTSQ